MKKKRQTILIIEKSAIIREGLMQVLGTMNDNRIVLEICDNISDLQQSVVRTSPKLLIASPDVFERHKKLIKSIREEKSLVTIALVYSFYHPKMLNDYDAQFYINDEPEKMRTKIKELLSSIDDSEVVTQRDALTKREKEILKYLVSGQSSKEIGDTLHISAHTVNAHRKNIMRKLDIKTISGLTIYAVLNNIINLKEA
ncbi:MAG: response regulator transcription factor [Bacteroidota bacterium]